jgi:hypothetical protein
MMNNLPELLSHVRSKIDHFYDATNMFSVDLDLIESLKDVDYKGFYIGIVDLDKESVAKEGFLTEARKDIIAGAEPVISQIFDKLKSSGVSYSQYSSYSVHVTVVLDVIYMPDPMMWDENKDGLYFQWGQRYKGMYLPYEIQQFDLPKSSILDRLCSWEAGIAGNLWRNPAGLCWKLVCSTISS